jgi:hypothetical protein
MMVKGVDVGEKKRLFVEKEERSNNREKSGALWRAISGSVDWQARWVKVCMWVP